jgi:hypothetical protein
MHRDLILSDDEEGDSVLQTVNLRWIWTSNALRAPDEGKSPTQRWKNL